jgi:hypothetical protein
MRKVGSSSSKKHKVVLVLSALKCQGKSVHFLAMVDSAHPREPART